MTLLRISSRLILLPLFLVIAPFALADWEPDPPMPDEWDWIQLNSKEWLKGEIIALYDDSVEIDSDELGILKIDFEDIKHIRTAQIMQVRFLGGHYHKGKMLVDGDTVKILDGSGTEFHRDQVLTVIAGEEKEINYWSFKATIGANFRAGNTDQIEYNGKVNIMRRTVDNRFIFDYIGNYLETDNVESTNNHRVTAGWDKFITDRFFVTVGFGEYWRDPFQNIEGRYTVGALAGYQFIDNSKTEWSVSAGPAFQRTYFVNVEEGKDNVESTPAGVVATHFSQELSDDIDYTLDYRMNWVNHAAGTYTHHLVTGVEIELTSILDFDVTLVWDRIQNPKADSDGLVPKRDDIRLMFGLGVDF